MESDPAVIQNRSTGDDNKDNKDIDDGDDTCTDDVWEGKSLLLDVMMIMRQ